MHLHENERLVLLIDGPYLHVMSKALGIEVDFKRLLALFRSKGRLVRALYYSPEIEEQEFSAVRPLLDWLAYNGFAVISKPVKHFTDAHGVRKLKGSMNIQIAVDAMRLADAVDHIVLISGDSDFKPLVAMLQEKGKRVSIVSTLATQPAMVADELRRQADQFVDMAELEALICRDRPAVHAHSKPVANPQGEGAVTVVQRSRRRSQTVVPASAPTAIQRAPSTAPLEATGSAAR